MEAQPEVSTDRVHALLTCPASAPDPIGVVRDPAAADLEAQRRLDPVVAVASAQLGELAEEERGEVWLDLAHARVVVQVTHDADAVLAAVRARLEDPATVAVELVRYSRAKLLRWRDLIIAMDDIGWTTVGCGGANNRVDVGVRGDAATAWRRIAATVEPCAFRVEGGVDVVPLRTD